MMPVYNSARALRLCAVLLLFVVLARGDGPVYVALWFDTEDYIDPASDDAALRIATDLTNMGVRATFKVVGEEARSLERRGRTDVIQAIAKHSVGYHSNWHSIQPTPAVYEQHLGFLEGISEFDRRERIGFDDVRRIFGKIPVCYGQPGSSWAPQSNPVLRAWGIHVYLDDGIQVGVNDQPIWYDGLLYVYNLGQYQIRSSLDPKKPAGDGNKEFDAAVRRIAMAGGGLISIYYHPNEFVSPEFWDAVNFAHGAVREKDQWVKAPRRSPEDAERCYRILHAYVDHIKHTPGVHFVAADNLLSIYDSQSTRLLDRRILAEHFGNGLSFLSVGDGVLSAADILLQLLGLPPQYVDGPTRRGITTYSNPVIPAAMFGRAEEDLMAFIKSHRRLPNEVFIGSRTMSLPDFAATLAHHVANPGPIQVVKGKLDFEKYVSTDSKGAFQWPIDPDDFAAPELLDLARLQAWTLKPARLRINK